MNSKKRTTYFLILSLLVAGSLSISAAIAGDVSSERSEEVSQLLSQIKTEAIALEDDADVLASWTRARNMSWQSHASKLHKIKGHVNQAGDLLDKLNKAREGASPWQQQAIDRIYPLLKELAENAETTINHLNDNQANIHYAAYQDYTKANYILAEELAALISDYVEYGNHEAEFHRLQEKLNTTES